MAEAKEAVKPEVVIIDTIRKIHTMEENSSTDMTKVFNAINAVEEVR